MFLYMTYVFTSAYYLYKEAWCILALLLCAFVGAGIIIYILKPAVDRAIYYSVYKEHFGPLVAAKRMMLFSMDEWDFDTSALCLRGFTILMCSLLLLYAYTVGDQTFVQNDFVLNFETELGQYLASKLGWLIPSVVKCHSLGSWKFWASGAGCLLQLVAIQKVFPYHICRGLFWYIVWRNNIAHTLSEER